MPGSSGQAKRCNDLRRGRGRRDFDITEIDITQSAITEFDITDSAITESDITESAITRKGKLL